VSPYPGSIRADVPWPTGASNAELQTDQEAAPRQDIFYDCPRCGPFPVTLAANAKPQPAWPCRCGKTARLDGAPADAVADFGAYNASLSRTQPKRGAEETTPWAQLMKRRTKAEGEVILAEAMERAKEARGGS
jgi:hypothetical protein